MANKAKKKKSAPRAKAKSATVNKSTKSVAKVSAKPAETPKARRLKRPASVRERADKATASSAKPKKRVIHTTARGITLPFRLVGRLLFKILRPFRFLLWPFKRRPVRFVGRVVAAIFFLKFIRNSYREVRTVTWPARRDTIRLTFAVFMFAIVFGTIISLTDLGLDKVFKKLLLK